jgi:UDP-N-acetylglucosamine--N-acetylmuramyl-(pentapeptide) pyrophosphoryl-undecaprenol N-acetylglucosamine transferase
VENAKVFEKAGAAVVIGGGGDVKKTAAVLSKTVAALAEDTERRNAMAAASACLGKRDGAEFIARSLLAALKENGALEETGP